MHKTGWIGLGKMGNLMAQRLLTARYPLTVYNRTAAKAENLRENGAIVSATPGAVAEASDIIFIMVTDDEAVKEIVTGREGLLSIDGKGKTIVNMSTVSAGLNREMADSCANAGYQYIDAPVSGSMKQAQEGSLVIIAGGEEAIFNQVLPLLKHMSKQALHLGPLGAGNDAKLAVNLLLGIINQGLAEAMVFAQQKGIKQDQLMEVLNNGALASPYLKIKGDLILNTNYQPAFLLNHIVKDIQLAKDAGMDTPLGNAALETYKAAQAEYGSEDLVAVYKQLEARHRG